MSESGPQLHPNHPTPLEKLRAILAKPIRLEYPAVGARRAYVDANEVKPLVERLASQLAAAQEGRERWAKLAIGKSREIGMLEDQWRVDTTAFKADLDRAYEQAKRFDAELTDVRRRAASFELSARAAAEREARAQSDLRAAQLTAQVRGRAVADLEAKLAEATRPAPAVVTEATVARFPSDWLRAIRRLTKPTFLQRLRRFFLLGPYYDHQ